MKKEKEIKPDELKTTKEVFGFPFETFKDSKDLRRQMLEASENTLFLIGENVIKYPEGREVTELVWARVFRTRDELTLNKPMKKEKEIKGQRQQGKIKIKKEWNIIMEYN